MPHASLLGSNGHHCAFTSEMISGHINVFIVLQEEGRGGKKKKKDRETQRHLTHARVYVYVSVQHEFKTPCRGGKKK